MNIRRRFAAGCILALGALAAAGCSSEKGVTAENESVEAVAEKVAGSTVLRPKPGRWEATVKLDHLDVPNMPPEAKELMQQHMNSTRTSVSCLTPEEAQKPSGEFFQPEASGCIYEKFVMGDGKLDAVMSCENDGQMQKMAMNGTYDEENYSLNVTSEGVGPQGMPVSMAMSVTSTRVGECTGEEEK